MSEIIITNKTVSFLVIIGVVLVALAGAIGYNVGRQQGLEKSAALANLPVDFNLPASPGLTLPSTTTPATNTPTSEVKPEVPISGGVVQVGKTNLATGLIMALGKDSFSLKVTSTNFNSGVGTISQKATTYQVNITKTTKMTNETTTIKVPSGPNPPQVTTVSKPLAFSDLKVGQVITVGWTGSTSGTTITATEVTQASTVRK